MHTVGPEIRNRAIQLNNRHFSHPRLQIRPHLVRNDRPAVGLGYHLNDERRDKAHWVFRNCLLNAVLRNPNQVGHPNAGSLGEHCDARYNGVAELVVDLTEEATGYELVLRGGLSDEDDLAVLGEFEPVLSLGVSSEFAP